MSAAREKAELRQQIRSLPLVDFQPLLDAFLTLPEVNAASTILLFYGVGREPDMTGLIDALWQQGKTIVLPKCLPKRKMETRQITPGSRLICNAYGIPEPDEGCPLIERDRIDLILVPNLCCDKQGYRLGRGGGYYDRFLSGYAGLTVALCPEEWIREELPREEFDLPVDLVVTQTQVRYGAKTPYRA